MRPSATRTLICCFAATPGDRGDDVAVGVLEHGVAALQGGQRRQRPGPGALVADVVGRPGRGACRRVRRARSRSWSTSSSRASSRRARVGQRRPGAERVEPGLLAGDPAGRRVPRSRSRARVDAARLLGHVGHDQLGGVGGGRGADVGDQVEQRAGRARGRSRRPRACGPRATARISASSEKGSRSSTDPPPRATTITSTAGLRSSRSTRLDHLGGRARALHRGVGDLEADRRPAPLGVLEHVALGGASWAR